MKEIITSSNAPPPVGPYSQAVALDGFIFLSGQVGRKPDTTDLEEGVAAQTRQAILNMQAVLAEKNLTLDNVVKTSVFLADMNDFAEMNAVYAEFFDEDTAPARSTIEVSRLPLDALMEIDAIAEIQVYNPRDEADKKLDRKMEKLVEEGKITPDQFEEYKKIWNDEEKEVNEAFIQADKGLITQEELDKKLEEINKIIDQRLKDADFLP